MEQDPRVVYADIIHLPRPEPRSHPRMPLKDRAAQFAPFAALSGYSDMIEEEARLTESEKELTGDEREEMNRCLLRIRKACRSGSFPRVTLTLFVPDRKKSGGSYHTLEGVVRALDPVSGTLAFLPGGHRDREIRLDLQRIIRLDDGGESGL